MHVSQLIISLQVMNNLFKDLTDDRLRESQSDLKKVEKRTFFKVVDENRNSTFWVVETDSVNLDKR